MPDTPSTPPPPSGFSSLDLPEPDWQWETEINLDGTAYQATYVPGHDRWSRIAFVRGVPPQFEDDLLRAAQDADTAPAWQVEAREGEPIEERIARARQRLRNDLDAYRTDFVTMLGMGPAQAPGQGPERAIGQASEQAIDQAPGQGPERAIGQASEQANGQASNQASGRASGPAIELLGCAGARRRITVEHESAHWQVLARVLARPELRGQGLARRLAVPFMRAARALGGAAYLGFLNETQSLPVVMLLQLGQRAGALDTIVGFGSRRHADAPDRTYLALYRGVRPWLEASGARVRAEVLLSPALTEVVALCEAAWGSGLDHDRLQRLAALASAHGEELRDLAGQRRFFAVCADFIAALRAWGLFDGVRVA